MKVRILVAVPKYRLGLTEIAITLERGDPDNPTHSRGFWRTEPYRAFAQGLASRTRQASSAPRVNLHWRICSSRGGAT